MENKIKIAILGATGSVGQKFVELLINHPEFEIHELAASERSAGKKYCEAANWMMPVLLPENLSNKIVKNCTASEIESEIVFSGLDASVAGEIEEEFARAGKYVISNARNHRYDQFVPLIVPEVNYGHLELIKKQSYKGAIVTNPNCSTIGLSLALKPLYDNFGLELVNIVTMQAISGAGVPGIPSMEILENVVPYIGGEEEKMQKEPWKILGEYTENGIKNAEFKISAQCNRVPVIDGHTECVQVKLKNQASQKDVIEVLKNFTSKPQELGLPFAPVKPIYYFENEKYPQPKLHRNLDKGMAVSIGRLRECEIFDYKFVILSHNTIRGAAGGTLLIAEVMQHLGYIS